MPSGMLQAESHKSEEAQAHCQAQGGTAKWGTYRCSTVQLPVAQVALAAMYGPGTAADLALLAVVGNARVCTFFLHQVPRQSVHCTQEGKGHQAWLTTHPGSHRTSSAKHRRHRRD